MAMAHADDPQPCDLLIEAGVVVPVVPHGAVLANHAVAVRGERIVEVLPVEQHLQRKRIAVEPGAVSREARGDRLRVPVREGERPTDS